MIEENKVAEPNARLSSRINIGEPQIPHGIFRLEKYPLDARTGERISPEPDEVIEFENEYTNTGGALFLDLLSGAGGTALNNANAHLGVGDSAAAFAVAQTDLQAATNKLRKPMAATFPSRSGQVMTWKSTFLAAEANWVWNEGGMFTAVAAGIMFTRKVQNLGTKTSAAEWDLLYTITIP